MKTYNVCSQGNVFFITTSSVTDVHLLCTGGKELQTMFAMLNKIIFCQSTMLLPTVVPVNTDIPELCEGETKIYYQLRFLVPLLIFLGTLVNFYLSVAT